MHLPFVFFFIVSLKKTIVNRCVFFSFFRLFFLPILAFFAKKVYNDHIHRPEEDEIALFLL